jgi:hypothetical protein
VKQLLGKIVVREEFRNDKSGDAAEVEAADESVVDWDEVYASVVADEEAELPAHKTSKKARNDTPNQVRSSAVLCCVLCVCVWSH